MKYINLRQNIFEYLANSAFEMKFVLIFGAPAVGKMTVGQELERITGFRLLHNHMTIELVLNFFQE